MSEPSAAAMRAAKAVRWCDFGDLKEIATIIDREIGLPELLGFADEYCVQLYSDYEYSIGEGPHAEGDIGLKEKALIIEAILAKAKGTQ